MMTWFDYIFYRLYIVYNKKESTPLVSAVTAILILQICIAFFIIMITDFSTNYIIRSYLQQFNKLNLKVGIVITCLLLDILNYFYYKKRLKILLRKYNHHPWNKKFKVWMLYFVGAGLLILPFLYRAALMAIIE
jgi:hypothetical protein